MRLDNKITVHWFTGIDSGVNNMMTVSVNSEQKQIDTPCSIAQALMLWQYRGGAKVAVAVNGEFVPRSEYDRYLLSDNDCIDIVAPIQGG